MWWLVTLRGLSDGGPYEWPNAAGQQWGCYGLKCVQICKWPCAPLEITSSCHFACQRERLYHGRSDSPLPTLMLLGLEH